MGPTNGILYSYDMARVWEPTSQLGVGPIKINVRTIENADILVTRFDNETANGVLWVIKHKGMTGYGAQKLSTSTNKKPHTELAAPDKRMRPGHLFRRFETESQEEAPDGSNKRQRAEKVNTTQLIGGALMLQLIR
jgi:hypothetical protein